MKGDFSRNTFAPEKQYSSVRLQQGRVLLDADWNEQVDIQRHRHRQALRDLIGYAGGPEGNAGFAVEPAGSGKLKISPGHYYVDGILCENADSDTIDPSQDGQNGAGLYLAYLDVWERHVTALEDGELREIALGGPDTTTRTQIMSKVRVMKINADQCAPFTDADWAPPKHQSTGTLAARTVASDHTSPEDKDCLLTPETGYRGLENQLYRVEIHEVADDDTFTLKWSRENGTIASRWTGFDGGNKLTISTGNYGVGAHCRAGDWVELIGDTREAKGRPGVLVELASTSDSELTVKPANEDLGQFSQQIAEKSAKVRLWNGKGKVAKDGGWLDLEDGLQVAFGDGDYRPGDYWLIPARAFVDGGAGQGQGDILWPRDEGEPQFERRHGTAHVYAPLAICRYAGGTWDVLTDCRTLFAPLTKTETGDGACQQNVRVGENIQTAVDRLIQNGGGSLLLCAGEHIVEGELRLNGAQNVVIGGESEATRLILKREDGKGGIILQQCQNVTVEQMTILGEDVRALIRTDPGEDLDLNRQLTLRHLTLVNSVTLADARSGSRDCALWLSHAEEITIESCRLAAPVGIVSLLGASLQPSEVNSSLPITEIDRFRGRGVHRLRLDGVTIRYGTIGIASLKSEGWVLADCDIQPWVAAAPKSAEAVADPVLDSQYAPQDVEDLFPPISIQDSVRDRQLPGIVAHVWRDCVIRDSRVHSLHTLIWMGGRASHNQAGYLGTVWLHEADWLRNKVVHGGLGFGGSYRARIEDNVVHGETVGLWTISEELLNGVGEFFEEFLPIAGLDDKDAESWDAGRIILGWLFLEELATAFGLEELKEAAQGIFDAILTETEDPVPVLLWASQQILTAVANGPRAMTDGRWARIWASIRLPIIDTSIADNEIEGQRTAMYLDGFIPLGGLRIVGNRLTATDGRALHLEATPTAANGNFNLLFLQHFLAQLQSLPETLRKKSNELASDEQPLPEALTFLAKTLDEYLSAWGSRVEAIPAAEQLVETNRLSSRDTAIETNLWDVIIRNNHITLCEQQVTLEERREVVVFLVESERFRTYADALQSGAAEAVDRYSTSLTADMDALMAEPIALANTISRLRELLEREAWREGLSALEEAVKEEKVGEVGTKWPALTDTLRQFTGGHGIVVRSPAYQILGNHILVPAALRQTRGARGGIRIGAGTDSDSLPALVLYLSASRSADRGTAESLQLTLSYERWGMRARGLIAGNEITGGFGHGIDTQSLNLQRFPYLLTVRDNQIQNMGGQGLFYKGNSLDRVAVEANSIVHCGKWPELLALVGSQGGFVLEGVAQCRIVNNRIADCGYGTSRDSHVTGTKTLYLHNIGTLVLGNNELLANQGIGAILLHAISNSAKVQANHVVAGEDVGLYWMVTGAAEQVGDTTAAIHANFIQMLSANNYAAIGFTAVNGHRLKQLNLTGNSGAAANGSNSPYAFIDNVEKGMAIGNVGMQLIYGDNCGSFSQNLSLNTA